MTAVVKMLNPYHQVSAKCESLAELAEKVQACAKLGLRDVTVTTVPRHDSNVLVDYILDAKQLDS